jgi:hypothetical protein
LGIPIFLGIGAAGLLLWFLEKHSNNLAKRNSQIWNFQKIGIPKTLEFKEFKEFPNIHQSSETLDES